MVNNHWRRMNHKLTNGTKMWKGNTASLLFSHKQNPIWRRDQFRQWRVELMYTFSHLMIHKMPKWCNNRKCDTFACIRSKAGPKSGWAGRGQDNLFSLESETILEGGWTRILSTALRSEYYHITYLPWNKTPSQDGSSFCSRNALYKQFRKWTVQWIYH